MKPEISSFRPRSPRRGEISVPPWLLWWTPRRALNALLWSVTLILLLYMSYLWHGKRAWESYKEELSAKGESLNWFDSVPDEVPKEANFATTPFLAPLFDYKWDSETSSILWRDTNGYKRLLDFAPEFGWQQRGATMRKLALSPEGNAPARKKAAAALLEVLKPYSSVLAELHEAAKRPQARFGIHYEDGPLALLPHLEPLTRLSHILYLKCDAEIELERPADAFESLSLLFSIANALREEPFLPSQNSRRKFLEFIITLTHKAVDRSVLKESQFKELQDQFEKQNLLLDFANTLRAERVLGNLLLDQSRDTSNPAYLWEPWDPTNQRSSKTSRLLGLLPSGWFYKNQVEYNRIFQDLVLSGIDGKDRRVFPSIIDKASKQETARLQNYAGWIFDNSFIAAQLLLPKPIYAYKAVYARTQVQLDQAMIACALHRYRLSNGEYPESLSALSPGFAKALPDDPFAGKPYLYRRLDSDRFILYSVGWNERDDNGVYRGELKESAFRKLPPEQRKDDLSWSDSSYFHLVPVH